MKTCGECGMPVDPGQYHPYTACLLFKQTHSSAEVEANLAAVVEHGAAGARAFIAAQAADKDALRAEAAREERAFVRRELLAGIVAKRSAWAIPEKGNHSEREIGATTAFAAVIAALDCICPEGGQLPACGWTEDDSGCWWTGCGQAFELTNGAPSENAMRFCCYCGRPLAEKRFEPEPEEKEDLP